MTEVKSVGQQAAANLYVTHCIHGVDLTYRPCRLCTPEESSNRKLDTIIRVLKDIEYNTRRALR